MNLRYFEIQTLKNNRFLNNLLKAVIALHTLQVFFSPPTGWLARIKAVTLDWRPQILAM